MPLAESDQANTPAAPVAQQTEAPQPAPAPRAASAPRSATATRFPYAAQPEWLPTQTNYWEGRGGAPIDYIVIHYTAISYARTLRAFSIRASDVSAHYVIRGDGHIAQIVGEADTAWHAGSAWFNRHSIGIELELDRITNPAFTPEQYSPAAVLADGWPAPDRPAVQAEDLVPPGGAATFSFGVKGTRPGTFLVPLRGVVDGAAWMDDLGIYTVITVLEKSARF